MYHLHWERIKKQGEPLRNKRQQLPQSKVEDCPKDEVCQGMDAG
jgi:hypothetical protein